MMNENENNFPQGNPEMNNTADTNASVSPSSEAQSTEHSYIPHLSDMSTVVAPVYGEEPKKRSPLPFIFIGIGAVLIAMVVFLIIYLVKGKTLSDKDRSILALSKAFGEDSIFAVMGGYEEEAGNGMFFPDYVKDAKETSETFQSIIDQGAETQFCVKLKDYTYDSGYGSYIPSISGLAISLNGQYAPKQGGIYQELKCTFAGFNLLKAEFKVDASSVAATVPDALDGYLSLDLMHFGHKFNEADEFINQGKEFPDHLRDVLNINPLELASFPDVSPKAFLHTTEGKDALKALYDSLLVEKNGAKKNATVGGVLLECDEFSFTVQKEAILTFEEAFNAWYITTVADYFKNKEGLAAVTLLTTDAFNESSDNFTSDFIDELTKSLEESTEKLGASLEDSITATLLVDKDNRLISMDSSVKVLDASQNHMLSFSLSFAGSQQLYDSVTFVYSMAPDNGDTATLKITDNGSTQNNIRKDKMVITIERNGNASQTTEINSEYALDDKHFHHEVLSKTLNTYQESVALTIDGSFDVAPEEIALDINSLQFNFEDSYSDPISVELGINAKISLLENEIKSLNGTQHNILDMTEDDFEELKSDFSNFFTSMLWQLLL